MKPIYTDQALEITKIQLRRKYDLLGFRCPCCNEELTEMEIDMYDVYEGMKEECYNKAMEAAYENYDQQSLQNLDLDLEA